MQHWVPGGMLWLWGTPELPEGASGEVLGGAQGDLQAGAPPSVHPSTRDKCRQVPWKSCTQVPQQKCRQVPHETCTQVMLNLNHSYWPDSHPQVPRQHCKQVPREHCVDVPQQKCRSVPHEVCNKVPQQNCRQVPQQKCQQVIVLMESEWFYLSSLVPRFLTSSAGRCPGNTARTRSPRWPGRFARQLATATDPGCLIADRLWLYV